MAKTRTKRAAKKKAKATVRAKAKPAVKAKAKPAAKKKARAKVAKKPLRKKAAGKAKVAPTKKVKRPVAKSKPRGRRAQGTREDEVAVPNEVGKARDIASADLESIGLVPEFSGSGNSVKSQTPKAGEKVSTGTSVNLVLGMGEEEGAAG